MKFSRISKDSISLLGHKNSQLSIFRGDMGSCTHALSKLCIGGVCVRPAVFLWSEPFYVFLLPLFFLRLYCGMVAEWAAAVPRRSSIERSDAIPVVRLPFAWASCNSPKTSIVEPMLPILWQCMHAIQGCTPTLCPVHCRVKFQASPPTQLRPG